MAQLFGLPNEVINHILGLIPRSDYTKLCLVNKSLRYYAEPFLYSTISLRWDYCHVPPIVSLLHTLLQRPELFSYIDSVSLHGSAFEAWPPAPVDTTRMQRDQFSAAINKFQVSYVGQWVDKLRIGFTSMDALAGLLIANLANTTFLAITYNFIDELDITAQVLRSKILGQLPKFRQLSRLIYHRQMDEILFEYEQVSPLAMSLFYIPTVTDLLITVPNPAVFQWPAGEPCLDHLTSLEVEWVYPRCLAEILARTRNLKSFSWNWEYCSDPTEEPDSNLDYDQIIAALLPLKGTLERLQFRLHCDPVWDSPEISISGSLDGLRDFERLTYLDVPLISLTGLALEPQPLECHIPHSVETLCLTGALLHHDDAVQWMLAWEGYWQEGWAWRLEAEDGLMAGHFWQKPIIDVLRALAEKCPPRLPRLRRVIFIEDCDLSDSHMVSPMRQLDLEHEIEFEISSEGSWAQRYLPDSLENHDSG
ncbi:unnamed protein product [Clonostachys solani]|uniref:F-box domain-containing protein n=1 Tax=Clonostachys solani TaxID=160281 RepID=A0A9P0EL51_9HYPO|nr:unnamed protein product [Clonostachys solani]